MVRLGLFLLVMSWAWCLQALEPVVITLHEQALVRRSVATLADIATVTGPEDRVAVLLPLAIQSCPDTRVRTINDRHVRAALAQAIRGQAIQVTGSCHIARDSVLVTSEDLVQETERCLRQRAVSDIDIEIIKVPAGVAIPADDDVAWTLRCDFLSDHALGEIPVRVVIERGGNEITRTLVITRVSQWAQVPIPTRDVTRGTIVSLADIRMERVDLGTGTYYQAALADVIGLQARMTLKANVPIPAAGLCQPPVVHGGSQVELIIRAQGFEVMAQVVAMSDGLVGDLIQVKRLMDGKLLSAQVLGPGQVLYNP